MGTMPHQSPVVIGGVDTHRDIHVAAALDAVGTVLGTATFGATGEGYEQLRGWLESFGAVDRVGVEGTGSWGAGLARALTAWGIEVVEVTRPNRQHRRRWGKNDAADAVGAAKAVLSGDATGSPRGGNAGAESLRLLKAARQGAVKARTAAANQIHAVVATAPETLRAELRGLKAPRIVAWALALSEEKGDPTDPAHAAVVALGALARRWQHLDTEINDLDRHLDTVVAQVAPPPLLNEVGVGTQVAAQLLITAGDNPHRLGTHQAFAALCGVSPVDASSGRHQRHRLNRGGDRHANAALYRAVIVRLRWHQPTRDYMKRRQAEGKTKRETIRCLTRYLARKIHRHLTQPAT